MELIVGKEYIIIGRLNGLIKYDRILVYCGATEDEPRNEYEKKEKIHHFRIFSKNPLAWDANTYLLDEEINDRVREIGICDEPKQNKEKQYEQLSMF